GNGYTIQCQIAGNTYYLKWENSGPDATNVLLVNAEGAGTNWILDSDHVEAYQVGSVDPASPNCPYLNGDTSNGAVNMVAEADLNTGSSWSLATFGSPPRRA